MNDTVSREAYELALQQAQQYQAYLVTLGGVVSALALFIGYKRFGLVTLCVTAIQTNTAILVEVKDGKRKE